MVDHLNLLSMQEIPPPSEYPIEMLQEETLEGLSKEELLAYAIKANQHWNSMFQAAYTMRDMACRFNEGYNDIVTRMDSIIMEEVEDFRGKMLEALGLVIDYAEEWHRRQA